MFCSHCIIETRIDVSYIRNTNPPTALFGPVISAAPVTFQHSILDQQHPIIELENHPLGSLNTSSTPDPSVK